MSNLETRLDKLEAAVPPEQTTVYVNFVMPADNTEPYTATCYGTGMKVTRQAGETTEQMVARLPVSAGLVRVILLDALTADG